MIVGLIKIVERRSACLQDLLKSFYEAAFAGLEGKPFFGDRMDCSVKRRRNRMFTLQLQTINTSLLR